MFEKPATKNMSLIHKALKKAEQEPLDSTRDRRTEEEGGLPPGEMAVGKPSLKSQLTPRTLVLLVLALLSLAFFTYKQFSKNKVQYPLLQANTAPAVVPGQGPTSSDSGSAPSVEADELIKQGKEFYKKGEFDKALDIFIQANAKAPSNADILNSIGLVYKKKDDAVQAENFYKRAIAEKSDCAECYNNMGVLKMSQGDMLEAILYIKKAIKYDETYSDAYFNLAVLNDTEGNFRQAIDNYKTFLQYTDSSDNKLVSKVEQRIEQLSE